MQVDLRHLPQSATQLSIAGVCSMFIPIKSNDYRPLALRHQSLAFVSALLITAKVLAISVLALAPAQAQLSTITVNRIVQLTNEERQKVGLNTLTVNSQLAAAAKEKGEHMLAEDYFAHVSPSGITPWFWMQKNGYAYQVAGENLAIDFTEAEEVVAAWIASPSHKENMLQSGYTETGVSVVAGEFQGSTSIIVVHMFGLPTGSPASTTAGTTKTIAEPTQETIVTPSPTPTVFAAPSDKPTPMPTIMPTPSPTPVPTIVPTPDTPPPRTPRIAYLLSPATDQSTVLALSEGQSMLLNVDTSNVAPQYNSADQEVLSHTPGRLSRHTRLLILAAGLSISILLILAVLIKVRIQRPTLIAHTSAVIGLAVWLLFV